MLRKRARLPVQMVFKLLAKLLHKPQRRHRRRITQWTKRPAHHVLRQVLYVVDVFLHAKPRMKPRQRLLQPVRSLAAGNAPPAALMLIKADRPRSEERR